MQHGVCRLYLNFFFLKKWRMTKTNRSISASRPGIGKPAYVTDGQTKGINKRWTKPPIVMKVAVRRYSATEY
jgi:hypothetical protein